MVTIVSRRVAALALVTLAFLLLAACGQGDNAEEGGSGRTPTTSTERVPGVSDTEIKLGTHLPLSQTPAAAYGPIADGMRAYFDYINDTEGGVHGRKITFIVGDDHYTPADTVEVVHKLVEQDQVFAIVAGLGEATHLAVWKYLEERDVPDLFISSGIQAWTNPVVKTRFGGNPVYLTEGEMLGQYIAREYDGKKLGLLVQNNPFGFEGEEGIRKGLEGSDVEVVTVETYEEPEFDVTAHTQRLKNSGAEVLVAYAIPPQAASLVKTARQVLNWDAPIVVSGVNASDIFIQLAEPKNAEGVVSVVFGVMMYETDHPGVKQHYDAMQKYAPGVAVSNITEYGYIIAELTVEGLKRAGRDLTRERLAEAIEGIKGYQCSLCMAPVSFSPTDHRPFEIEVFVKVEDGVFVPFGDPVDFESTRED